MTTNITDNIIGNIINLLFISLLRLLIQQYNTGPKINFITVNLHQIISCSVYIVVYLLNYFNLINNKTTKIFIEFVIFSLIIKIIYECTLFVNTENLLMNNLIKFDLNLIYKICTVSTTLLLYFFGSNTQCLNEMTNLILITIGSLYDLNVLFDMEHVVLGEQNANNKSVLKIMCNFLKPHVLKLYTLSTIFDICLVIYYKFFTNQFPFFFFYKVFIFFSISIKIIRLANSFDPSIPDFESASVKHLKKWMGCY